MLDFGGNDGVGGFVGAGAGYARVKEFSDSDSGFAWQVLAGVYTPLDYYVAAIRECFEESGLLFARADAPELVDLDGSDAVRLAPWRGSVSIARCM